MCVWQKKKRFLFFFVLCLFPWFTNLEETNFGAAKYYLPSLNSLLKFSSFLHLVKFFLSVLYIRYVFFAVDLLLSFIDQVINSTLAFYWTCRSWMWILQRPTEKKKLSRTQKRIDKMSILSATHEQREK